MHAHGPKPCLIQYKIKHSCFVVYWIATGANVSEPVFRQVPSHLLRNEDWQAVSLSDYLLDVSDDGWGNCSIAAL